MENSFTLFCKPTSAHFHPHLVGRLGWSSNPFPYAKFRIDGKALEMNEIVFESDENEKMKSFVCDKSWPWRLRRFTRFDACVQKGVLVLF